MTNVVASSDKSEPDRIARYASKLVAGDRIAAQFLPEGEPGDVVFVLNYTAHRESWTFVAFQLPDAVCESGNFLAHALIPLESNTHTTTSASTGDAR